MLAAVVEVQADQVITIQEQQVELEVLDQLLQYLVHQQHMLVEEEEHHNQQEEEQEVLPLEEMVIDLLHLVHKRWPPQEH